MLTRVLLPRIAVAHIAILSISALGLATGGCSSDSQASKGAADGAGIGAMSGAVSGMVGALVFGGDVVDAAARGAVYGGTAGAVAGGMSGSKRDKAAAEQQASQNEQELQQLRSQIGDDAFNGVVALAECKYEVAAANANVASQSANKNFALAGIWVDVLIDADQSNEAAARQRFPEIIKLDGDVKTEADAEAAMRDGLAVLMNARSDNGLPRICPS